MPEETLCAMFIDYENIHIGLEKHFGLVFSAPRLVKTLQSEVVENARFLVSRAYADWDRFAGVQREMEGAGIEPKFAGSKRWYLLQQQAGKLGERTVANTTDVKLALDAQRVVLTNPNIKAVLLASGDGAFLSLIQDLRRGDVKVFVCAVKADTSQDLQEAADGFFALEDLFGLVPTPRVTLPPGIDWEAFVGQVSSLEEVLPFVGLKYFRDQILSETTAGDQPNAKVECINDAIAQGIIEVYKVDNPEQPEFPTSAIRLNRQSPIVQLILGEGEPEETTPGEGTEGA